MKLVSWNINGIRAVANKNALDWIKSNNIDFIGFQEIKAKEDQIPKIAYNLGFSNISINSAARPGYSGVMSLAKFDTQNFKSQFYDDDQGRVLEHIYKNIHIFNIYFPNGQQGDDKLAYKMDFYAKFLDYIKNLINQGKSVIFCGDVNTAHKEIDLTHPKANSNSSGFLPIERAWIDEVIKAGFVDTFRYINGDIEQKYSWWSYKMKAREKNVGWRIDYFFISQNLLDKLKNAFILSEIYGSDHCPVGIEIDI